MIKHKKAISILCSCIILFVVIIPQNKIEAKSHLSQVMEMDSTYEGFLENDEMLSFDEISNIPGASIESEFDVIVDLKTMTESELIANGLNSSDIEIIQTKSVKEIILDHAATIPYNKLKEKGLSDSTINNIQTGNYHAVSEKDVKAASSKLAFAIASCARAGNSCNYSIYWHWDIEPSIKLNDTIAATISHNYWMTGNVTSKIGYAAPGTTNTTMVFRHNPTYASEESCRFDIPMTRGTSWCQSGKAFIATLGSYSPSGALIARAEYYHQESSLPVDFSVGVGLGGLGVGITWTSGHGTVAGESTVHI